MSKPRIILFDLETLPDLLEALKVWPQLSDYPGRTLRATVTSVICAGWKVYGEKRTHCINAWDFDRWKKNVNDDLTVVTAIHKVLEDCDAVITHNGKRFDWKFLQTRFIKYGLKPFDRIPHIDTKELASKNLFAFNNRLGYLGEQFAHDKKLSHEGWELWVKVYHKDPKAMLKMTRYCKQDVNLLEKLFERLKPFATAIPNYNLWIDEDSDEGKVCPSCGSPRLYARGWRHTKARSYRRMQCKECGAYSRLDMKGENPR